MVLNWLKNKATDNKGLSALWSGDAAGSGAVTRSGFTRSKMAPSRGKQFLNQWAGPLIGGLLGAPFGGPGMAAGALVGGALGTREAQKARRDPYRGPFEFGLSEGLGSILGGKGNRDSVGKGVLGASSAGRALGAAGDSFFNKGWPSQAALDAYTSTNINDAFKKGWMADTADSPAAQGGFDPDERFQLQVNHQQWLKDRGRRYDTNFDAWLR